MSDKRLFVIQISYAKVDTFLCYFPDVFFPIFNRFHILTLLLNLLFSISCTNHKSKFYHEIRFSIIIQLSIKPLMFYDRDSIFSIMKLNCYHFYHEQIDYVFKFESGKKKKKMFKKSETLKNVEVQNQN